MCGGGADHYGKGLLTEMVSGPFWWGEGIKSENFGMFGEINCENLEYFRAIKRENLENSEIFGRFNKINFEDFGKSCIFAPRNQNCYG